MAVITIARSAALALFASHAIFASPLVTHMNNLAKRTIYVSLVSHELSWPTYVAGTLLSLGAPQPTASLTGAEH